MVSVLPQPQSGVDRVARVNHAVGVAAVARPVVEGEGEEPVSFLACGRRGLGREVAEEFPPVVHRAVGIAVEGEPRVVGVGERPGDEFRPPVTCEVEGDAAGRVAQAEAVAAQVEEDGRRATAAVGSPSFTIVARTTSKLFDLEIMTGSLVLPCCDLVTLTPMTDSAITNSKHVAIKYRVLFIFFSFHPDHTGFVLCSWHSLFMVGEDSFCGDAFLPACLTGGFTGARL